jgi:hypothetical protein
MRGRPDVETEIEPEAETGGLNCILVLQVTTYVETYLCTVYAPRTFEANVNKEMFLLPVELIIVDDFILNVCVSLIKKKCHLPWAPCT